jgi:hypothetical protein
MCTCLHVSYPLFLSDFNEFDLSRQTSKNTQMPNFMEICPVGADLFPVNIDGRTDMTQLIVVFRNFANAPTNRVSRQYETIGLVSWRILWEVRRNDSNLMSFILFQSLTFRCDMQE